jgi:peptidase E
MKRQIIAMGGGGFTMEPGNPLLDDYVLQQCQKENPSVCFLGTASGDSAGYIELFYEHFDNKPCTPTHLSLFNGHTPDTEGFLLSQDIIYVGGGNTKCMLGIWREWGLDQILRKAWQQGTILSGLSAGSICWFEEGLTDSIPTKLSKLNCLGFLPGSNCPHFDSEAGRRPQYIQAITRGEIKNGIAADDGCALHFVDDQLFKVVSSRPDANAYRFTHNGNATVEEVLKAAYLG